MSNKHGGTPYQSPDSTHARQMRQIRKSSLVGATVGALLGAFFGLIAPITVGVAGFALIYLPPPSWFWPSAVVWQLGAVGGLEWMIAGYALGTFIGAVRRVPQRETPAALPNSAR